MAPSCSVDESGHFSDPEGCAAEESGVRGSLAVAYSWVTWSLLFFWLARRAAKRSIAEGRREEFNPLLSNKEKGGDETERGNPFKYYHAKFRPDDRSSSSSTGASMRGGSSDNRVEEEESEVFKSIDRQYSKSGTIS